MFLLCEESLTHFLLGDMFYDFVCTELPPKHMPFNGSNCNSVLLLDNYSIHHVPELHQAFNDAQVFRHYLPPYSPDYNPIELAFSKAKYLLKQWRPTCKHYKIWTQYSWLHSLR